MNGLITNEHQSYLKDAEMFERLYCDGTPKEVILEKLADSFERYVNPKYKAHFLYMASTVLLDLKHKQVAYELCVNNEKNFKGTLFSQAAADRAKFLFIEEMGRITSPKPSFALSVQVEPTNCCNLDCIMCGRNKKRESGFMSFNTFKKIVDQSLSAGAIGIRLYHMGEPLLHKSIHEFVEYFNRQKQNYHYRPPCVPRSIGIQTNGVLINEDLAFKLMKAGLNELAFSIDGRTPQEYEKIRKGTKFDRVLNNLNIVKKVKDAQRFSTQISVSVLDMELDVQDKVRLNELYRKNGAEKVAFMPCGLSEGRHVVNKDGDIISTLEAREKHNLSPMETVLATEENAQGIGDIDRIVVLWNGDIKAACGEPSSGDIIGNIDHLSLSEAYKIKMEQMSI